jgi:TRAP-type C4-dicarboxylate transport system permease small subunit
MMLLVAADVIGRYVFNSPIYGAMEMGELMMVILVFLGMSYCTLERAHVRVELLVSRFSERTQVILDIIMSIASAAIFALIVWQMGMQGWQGLFSPSGRITLLLGLKEAPFLLIAAIGSLLMCLELLVHSFHSLAKVISS